MLIPTAGAPRTTSAWDAALSARYGDPRTPLLRDDIDASYAGPAFRRKSPGEQEDDDMSLLGFLGNVAGDVKDVAIGFFPGLYDVGKTIAQGTYGGTIGLIPGTGGDLARRSFNANAQRLADATWGSIKQSGSNWGRVFTGDFKPLYEDAAFMGLDVAALASGGGAAAVKGASLAAKAGRKKIIKVADDPRVKTHPRVVRQARKSGGAQVDMSLVLPDVNMAAVLDDIGDARLAANYAKGSRRVARYTPIASSTKLAARQRPNKLVESAIVMPSLEQLAESRGLLAEKLVGPEGTVSVPQRNLARTWLARQIQKPVIAGIDRIVESPVANKLTRSVPQRLSRQRMAARVINEIDRGVRDRAKQRAQAAGIGPYEAALKDREVRKDPLAKVAAFLHIEGVLGDRFDLTPEQARENAVRTATAELERLRKHDPEIDPRSLEDAEQQVRYLQEIPDELLTLRGDSPKVKAVRRVVETGRTYARNLERYDLYDLDEIDQRAIREERRTLSQRLLVGGARPFDYGGPRTAAWRAMVPEVFIPMVRRGEVFEDESRVASELEKLGDVVRETRRGGRVTGQLAYNFLAETQYARTVRGLTSDKDRLRFLHAVEEGLIRTSPFADKEHPKGRLPNADERDSARREITAILSGERREKPLREQDIVTAYRVVDENGNRTQWVRSPDGAVPEVLGSNRRKGDVLERAQIPAKAWFNRQDYGGRVDRLPEKLETGSVSVPDGRTFGVVERREWGGRREPEAGDQSARFDLPEPRRPARAGAQSVERLRGVISPEFARALENSSLSPASREAVVELLEFGEKRREVAPAKLVVRRLIEAGLVDISKAAQELRRGGFTEKAIAEGMDELFRGKLPLDKDGYVNLEALSRRLRVDPLLGELWDSPKLLSKVEILPGAYLQHRNVSSFGGQNPLGDKTGRATTSPVSPERGIQRTRGTLAKRLGYSLDPSELISTSSNLLRVLGNREFLATTLQFAASEEKVIRNLFTGKPQKVREPIVYTGRTARSLDKKKWVAIPVESFNKAEAWLRGWNPGDDGIDGSLMVREIESLSDDVAVYVFPRAFGERMKYAWSNPSNFWKGYDSLLQMWRAGVLTFAPRWYINNGVGNTIFYGTYTGFDLYSIRLARQIGDGEISSRVTGDAFSSQFYDEATLPGATAPRGKTRASKWFWSVSQRGYELNGMLEGAIRKGAYVHAVRKLLKQEGLLAASLKGRKSRRAANDADMLEAIASAPDYIKTEAIREMERWMGDYRNLGRFEREVVRRALPFYSWLKVINTWLFGLPFRSPIRAELLAMAGKIGNELAGDRSYLPWWDQGRLELTDRIALRTSGLNPFQSVIEPLLPLGIKGGGWDQVGLEMIASVGGQLSPPLQVVTGLITGKKTFGDRAFTAPPGYGGTATPFGKEPQSYNTITGQIESRSRKGNPLEAVFQVLPLTTQIRDVLSAGRTAYDTASTLDLVLDKLGYRGSEQLYQPPAKSPSGREKITAPGVGVPLGFLGFPLYKYDKTQERGADARRRREFKRAQRSTSKLIGREQARRDSA